LVERQKLALSDKATTGLPDICDSLRSAPNWSNGRDVRTFLEFALRAQAGRIVGSGADPNVLTDADLDAALRAFLDNKAAGAMTLPTEANKIGFIRR
jgi:hypothetical protein